MSGKQPLRGSSRTSRAKTFGEDFTMDNPSKRSRREPDPPLPKLPDDPGPVPQPTPSTSREEPQLGVPGGGDPDPEPTSPFKWSSDPENWRKPRLPTRHSKCLYILVSALFGFISARSKRHFESLGCIDVPSKIS